MVVTVLARYEGVDTSGGGTWYEGNRDWAMQAGISDGSDMERDLTREQLAAMLWRYADRPDPVGTLTGYTDASAVSDYAADAMTWVVENRIIVGTSETTLAPQSVVTRGQVATMLMRFISTNV